jgi:enoyl-CoA hydratase
MGTFEHILVERNGAVGLITLNRPKMLNALSFGVFREIAAAVDDLEADDSIGCILLTGSEKAFAAGADIKEMQPKTFIDMFSSDFTAIGGDRVARCRKPTIAAVSGYALGGGCELAMMCDIIIAADTAKSKAMDLCLTGRMMDAAEAERSGLVSRVVAADKLIEEALAAAEKIAGMSHPAAAMAKEAINRAFETPLSEGMNVERNLFHSTFALEDRSEGMAAFIEKRKPVNKNR